MRSFKISSLFFVLFLLTFCAVGVSNGDTPHRIYPNRYDPAFHPDRGRNAVVPPDWSIFGGKTNFICMRGLPSGTDPNTGHPISVEWEKAYQKYADAGLGTIIWPFQNTIYYENLDQIADWAKKNNLFIFDLWGYVPGSGPYGSGDWVQNRPPKKQFQTLKDHLGAHWLGMDNGEQDGRYIGGYAPMMNPVTLCRFDQYLNFQRHFERLGDDLDNRLATLVSLNFGHYFLKEGIYTLIGAETAQGLPNSQVYYSWIRGAGKQYGVLWFGNASIYNRWGFKAYPDKAEDGASLNLLKRLMYSQIFYNSAAVGFENGWFCGEELSPIGKIQRDAARWLDKNGDPGTMITPVALLSDFFCGWSFPRHLYSSNYYRVWGNVPYGPGDYLNNNLLDLLYPGYQNSSYYHNESGFLTPTPYGDCADSLLTDAPLWLLNRYQLLILADRITGGDPRQNREGEPTRRNNELIKKLTKYVEAGGRLVLTAGNLEALDGAWGMHLNGLNHFEEGSVIQLEDGSKVTEPYAFSLYSVTIPENAKPIAFCGNETAAFEFSSGSGSVLVLDTPFAVTDNDVYKEKIPYLEDASLPNPFPLLTYAEILLRKELDQTVLFDVGKDLGSIVCRKGDGIWTVAVFNNGLEEKPFEIQSRIGKIASVRELPITTEERNAVGFLPKGFAETDTGTHSDTTIAGADLRVFEVTLEEEKTELIPETPIPPRPNGKYLALRNPAVIKEEILARPTFFEHYDGITLDWRYINARTENELEKQAGWLKRHGIRIAVDFSSGINLYPDLRLTQNDPDEFNRSMNTFKEVIKKSHILGADRILLATHRKPENNYSEEQTYGDIITSFKEIGNFAKENGIQVSLRVDLNQPPQNFDKALKILNDVDDPNFSLAPRLALLLRDPEIIAKYKDQIGFILESGNLNDTLNGDFWTSDVRIDEGSQREAAEKFIQEHSDIPCIQTSFSD